MVAQRELYPVEWRSRIKFLPFLMATGIGLAVSNSKAVMEAIVGKQTEFVRTPKYRLETGGEGWEGKKYVRRRAGWIPIIELCLAAYFLFATIYSFTAQNYFTMPFLLLFFMGYSYMGTMSLFQTPLRRLASALPALLRPRAVEPAT
jgi:hypothetical protein